MATWKSLTVIESIVESNPRKFHLDIAELSKRKHFINNTRQIVKVLFSLCAYLQCCEDAFASFFIPFFFFFLLSCKMFQIITTCQYDNPSFQMMVSFIRMRVSIISLPWGGGGEGVLLDHQFVWMKSIWKCVWTVLKEMKEQMSSPAAVSLDKRNKKVSEKVPQVSHHSSAPDCYFRRGRSKKAANFLFPLWPPALLLS